MRQRLAYAGFSAIGALLGFLVNSELSAVMAVAFAAVLWIAFLRRSRAGDFVADGRTLSAPLTLWHPAMIAAVLGSSISQARSLHGRDGFFSSANHALGIIFVVVAVAMGVLAAAMVVRPPVLCLTSEGVLALSYRERLLRWDDLPGPVTVTGKPRASQTVLLTRRKAIAAAMLGMDAARFAAVVEYYRTHPERRAAIGTAAEYDRMFTAAS